MKVEHGTAGKRAPVPWAHTAQPHRVTQPHGLAAKGQAAIKLCSQKVGAVVLLIIRRFNKQCTLLAQDSTNLLEISTLPHSQGSSARLPLLLSLPIISGTQGITIILSTHTIYPPALFILHWQHLYSRLPSQKYKITRFNKPPGTIKKLSQEAHMLQGSISCRVITAAGSYSAFPQGLMFPIMILCFGNQ